jgi:hypothetical protein
MNTIYYNLTQGSAPFTVFLNPIASFTNFPRNFMPHQHSALGSYSYDNVVTDQGIFLNLKVIDGAGVTYETNFYYLGQDVHVFPTLSKEIGLVLEFDNTGSISSLVEGYEDVAAWNIIFNLPLNGTPFKEVRLLGSNIVLLGATNITLKDILFDDIGGGGVGLLSIIDYAHCVKKIGMGTFGNTTNGGCPNLEVVKLPSAVSAGDDCFAGCSAIKELELPKLKVAGDNCFINLNNIYLKYNLASLERMGNSALKNWAVTEFIFPSLLVIGERAFDACGSGVIFDFPKVLTIGYGAFYNCTAMKIIKIPNCTNMGSDFSSPSDVFANITGNIIGAIFSQFLYNPALGNYDSDIVALMTLNSVYTQEGLIFVFTDSTLVDTMLGGTGSSVVNWNTSFDFPDDGLGFTDVVTSISNSYLLLGGSDIIFPTNYFNANTNILEIIDTANCVISVESSFAKDATNLTKVILPNITRIRSEAFSNCGIYYLYTPKIINLGDLALSANPLNSVYFPFLRAVTTSFTDCTELTRVDLPSLVQAFAPFSGCTVLEYINIPYCTVIQGETDWFTGISGVNIDLFASGIFHDTTPFNNLVAVNTVTYFPTNLVLTMEFTSLDDAATLIGGSVTSAALWNTFFGTTSIVEVYTYKNKVAFLPIMFDTSIPIHADIFNTNSMSGALLSIEGDSNQIELWSATTTTPNLHSVVLSNVMINPSVFKYCSKLRNLILNGNNYIGLNLYP